MERLPPDAYLWDERFPYEGMYFASSISDVVNNREIPIRDYEIRHQGRSAPFRFLVTTFELFEEKYDADAFVFVPKVRHVPVRDISKRRGWFPKITIFDETAECEATILNKDQLKREGRDPESLINQAWHSDIILLNSYSRSRSPDRYYLARVFNPPARETRRVEGGVVIDFVRELNQRNS